MVGRREGCLVVPILGVAGNIIRRDQMLTKRQTIHKHIKTNRRKRKFNELREAAKQRAATGEVVPQQMKVLPPTARLAPKPTGRGRERVFQLYALELEDGCFYVGMTAYANARRRFDEHAASGKRGALWTQLHKPRRIIETRQLGLVFESEAARAENLMTLEYMMTYGGQYVRGGDMCQVAFEPIVRHYKLHLKNLAGPCGILYRG